MRRPRPEGAAGRRDARRGAALVIALALITFGAALLAGATAAARAEWRAEGSREAVLLAGADARLALAEALGSWSAADDSMPIGSARARPATVGGGGFGSARVSRSVSVHRVAARLYLVVAECAVGDTAAVLARRRLSLIVRAAPPDSLRASAAPQPISRWSLHDLY